jgi:poly-gamma-glutamate synthesis protein (capsule biosynthesis protein)
MTGRGIDQILPHPGSPVLREPFVTSALDYIELAERIHGPIRMPVAPTYPWGAGLEILRREAPDAAIANLETSVCTGGSFWPGKSVHYRMHPKNLECLQIAPVDLYSLANNHSMDFARPGLVETLETLDSAGIRIAGAGRNLSEAARPVRICCSEEGQHRRQLLILAVGHPSSGIPLEWAAADDRVGVFLLDELSAKSAKRLVDHLASYREAGDLVVVSIHWGGNWGYEVSSEQTAFAHRLIDGGVDVVHGHSSHHARPVELYRGKLILYGCGDLLSDYEGIRGHERWRGDLGAMYFASLSESDGRLEALRLRPTRLHKLQLVAAGKGDSQWLTERLNEISRRFGTRFCLGDGIELVC